MSALDQKWHVTGSIQFQASGTMRYTQLPANKLQVRRVRLRLPPWPASSTLLYPRAHSDISFRGSIYGLGFAYCEFTRHRPQTILAHKTHRSNSVQPLNLRPSLSAGKD